MTLFNRGVTNPGLYPDVERIAGDRTGDLSALQRRRWDAVVDTSGYVPGVVHGTVEALREVGRYCFVSSVSAYAELHRPAAGGSCGGGAGRPSMDELLPDYAELRRVEVVVRPMVARPTASVPCSRVPA